MRTTTVILAGASVLALAAPARAQTNPQTGVTGPTETKPIEPIATPNDGPAPPGAAAAPQPSSTPSVIAPSPAEDAAAGEDIVVTGSRIVTNGFQSPTPVTVLAQEALVARAPSNIPDALNQLPQFRGSTSNNTSVTWNANSPNQGNYLNLRGLGLTRSLVLLDGVRVPPTSFAGGVDVNTLPQALVQRVDVVTGGASAAYGSDAVVGVINFILDKNFTGVKGSVQGGISYYGDTPSYRGTLAAGTGFAGGRGHIEGSIEHYYSGGIRDINKRPLGRNRTLTIGTGTVTQPRQTYDNLRFLRLSSGGTITSGPLNLFQFLPDGRVQPVDRGQPTIDVNTYSVGGSGGFYQDTWLTSRLVTDQGFGRVSYEFTDNLSAHTQVSLARASNLLGIRYDERFTGTATGVTIFRDNAYLRPDVVAQLGNLQSFTLGRISLDGPQTFGDTVSKSINANAGVDGKFELFGNDWRWDVNYVYGRSRLRTETNEYNNRRFYASIDAARDASGNIVCRVTLVNPGLLPGCVPMNIFGEGSPSAAAIEYVSGTSRYIATNEMNIGAVNFSGSLFDLPAGPLSVAFGGEVRRQTLRQTSNADPGAAAAVDFTGIRGAPTGVLISNFTNIGSARGKVDVKEAYGEINVPILRDTPFFHALDLNGAARVTDYSTSGTVVTWKVGVNYSPVPDLRLRSTLSRDIAAPTLFQLFAGRQLENRLSTDEHTNSSGFYISETGGNPDLRPERGTMLVAGGVFSPSFLPGLTLSVDYYHLKIRDAIGAPSIATLINNCERSNGTSEQCAFVIRPFPFENRTPGNFPTRVIMTSLNQAAIVQSGIDLEGSYRIPLNNVSAAMNGVLEFKTYLSRGLKTDTKATPTAPFLSTLGVGSNAKLRGSFEVNYANGPFSARFSERFTGRTVRSFIQLYVEDSLVEPNRWYADLNLNYKLDNVAFLRFLGGDDVRKEVFFTAQNLFNTKPPRVGDSANPGLQIATDRGKYDVVGGFYTVGARFRF